MNKSDPTRPADPFAKLGQLGADQKLFAQEPTREREGEREFKKEKEVTQNVTHKSTQISKGLSKHTSKTISTDDVEFLDFELRKVRKFRVNADIPDEWKEELDSLAFRLKVGKYELLTFVIGQFLGKVKRKDQT